MLLLAAKGSWSQEHRYMACHPTIDNCQLSEGHIPMLSIRNCNMLMGYVNVAALWACLLEHVLSNIQVETLAPLMLQNWRLGIDFHAKKPASCILSVHRHRQSVFM